MERGGGEEVRQLLEKERGGGASAKAENGTGFDERGGVLSTEELLGVLV
jgi:hypothetical protein